MGSDYEDSPEFELRKGMVELCARYVKAKNAQKEKAAQRGYDSQEAENSQPLQETPAPVANFTQAATSFLREAFHVQPAMLEMVDAVLVPLAPNHTSEWSEDRIVARKKHWADYEKRYIDQMQESGISQSQITERKIWLQSALSTTNREPWAGSEAYESAINDFIYRFNLEASWMRSAMRATVWSRKRCPRAAFRVFVSGCAPADAYDLVEFAFFPFEPYDTDMHTWVELTLNGFCDTFEDEVARGLERGGSWGAGILSRKRTRLSRPEERYSWLAKRIVLKESVRKIRDDANEDRKPKHIIRDLKTINRETNELAELLGLNLNSSPGRPKTSASL
jgi:hypothetical protein